MPERFYPHSLRATEAIFGGRDDAAVAEPWGSSELRPSVRRARPVVLVTLPLVHLGGMALGSGLVGALVGGLVVWVLG